MIELPHANELWIFFVYYVFAAAVGSMPAPKEASSDFYRWVFAFLNTLAANINRAVLARNGGSK